MRRRATWEGDGPGTVRRPPHRRPGHDLPDGSSEPVVKVILSCGSRCGDTSSWTVQCRVGPHPSVAALVAVRDRLSQSAGGKWGPLTGPNPTDRGKLGSKIHLITDRNGLPLSLGVSGAHMHDSQGLEPLVRGIAHPLPPRAPAPEAPALMGPPAGHPPPHRPQGHRVLTEAGPSSLGGRENRVLAGRLPPVTPPLRTQSRTLPRLRRHSPHRLPPFGNLAHGLSWSCCTSKQISPMDSAMAAA